MYVTGSAVRHLSAPGLEYKFDIAPGRIDYAGDLNFRPLTLRTLVCRPLNKAKCFGARGCALRNP